VRRYENRLINIHPSLLPAFPGLHTHRRALAEGVRIHGCTVHFVTPDLDHGPVIVQAAVPVLDDDDEATLAARVLAQEHQVYPLAVRWFAEGRLRLRDGRVRWMRRRLAAALIAPQLSRGNSASRCLSF
jgi:phosphoribosylglycinamide formyltransferase-1